MRKEEKITVGISVGDINGVGSEIILKTFEDKRMLELCTPVVFASAKYISAIKQRLKININFNSISNLNKIDHTKFNVVNCWKEDVEMKLGQSEISGGDYALKSFQQAVNALKKGGIDVLITAPINKENVQSDKFKFPGHTDYLNQELEGNCMMLMVSGDLRVGLLTDHVPINEVASHITEELIINKVNTLHHTLIRDFCIQKPKIALLGINPHTGDNGVIGHEDDRVLRPAIKKLKEENKLVYGPYPADSFFGSDNYKKFDAIIASYHDQGLIPFKTLSFGQGVNFTAGLDKIRTSPDHGTAFDIAGKGVADPSSFKEALFTAIRIFKNRETYKIYSANPLKKREARTTTKI